jgi:hypothetical protein
MKEQTWLAVDGHGNEYAFNSKPWRDFPNLDLRVKWGQRWVSDSMQSMDKRVKLPKGSIELLTGRVLTYKDEPVLLEYEDYGNYVETRPEVLGKDNDTWPL